MKITLHKLEPAWNQEGDYPYHYINRKDGLFDHDGLFKTIPLAGSWDLPELVIYTKGNGGDVYFCESGYFFFTERGRECLLPVLSSSAEWLPVKIKKLGQLYLLHPVREVPFGRMAQFRRNEVSGNITVVYQYDFERAAVKDIPIFYPSQPADSAAGKAGFCYHSIIVTQAVSDAMERAKLKGARCKPVVTL